MVTYLKNINSFIGNLPQQQPSPKTLFSYFNLDYTISRIESIGYRNYNCRHDFTISHKHTHTFSYTKY